MKKQMIIRNYLENIPAISKNIAFQADENGMVTLEIENKGLLNKIAQTLLKKPKISYIHLDELGSFIWKLIDKETTILAMGDSVKEQFGEKAEPLYPRLAKYISILESYNFVTLR